MGAKISKFVIPDSCYPSYQYTKRHAATIIDDYTEVRLRILQNQKPVIDKETRTDITLRVSEPLDKKLLLHPADFVLRASKKCRIHVENIGKTFALLYSSYFANSTVIAIERFGVEENEPVPLFLLLAEDKEDMAGFENRVLKNMQVCLKENVNVKICEMLERDIILQMKKVYEDLEKVQCYIENQQKTANHQKTIGIPCSCSNEKGSCKCYGSIIEEIKRLQADITGLVKRSKVPEDQKPQLNTDIEIEVDRKSGQKYSSTLLLEKFVIVDERFRVETDSVTTFLKKLKAVVNGHGLQYFTSVTEKTCVPQRESTPKSVCAYQCQFTFKEQVEIFRLLHPCAADNETVTLDKANRTFRVQCMKAMGLDPESRKVFFGGKFKVAIEVACMSKRCYECVTQVFERMGNIPGLINTSLF
ncbi:uncharacterized protein LOC128549570 isoform X3 [Mercenaria mercenaria]|uniref:uncharacterized protein LOC128549570 isoform X3 n=1 Tax=Mercenaria mercenaria TaxID=6596 RepID=UPI00234F77EF|nr:uncharacterized protein LOC128549570 isoform X3 [Mercenaria mercenaria]